MMAARNHEIDCVLVWKLDRFARSTRHLLAALEEFDHLGMRFISAQDQVDTESPMGRVMLTIIGAMAEPESPLISERVTAGMRAAEARGKHPEDRRLHRISSARSSRSPPQPTSAFGRSRPESPGAQAAAWSVRSPSGLASPHPHPCDHFLDVS